MTTRYHWRAYCNDPNNCSVCDDSQSEISFHATPQFATRLRQLGDDAGHADARLQKRGDT